jgi:hypothetical protein
MVSVCDRLEKGMEERKHSKVNTFCRIGGESPDEVRNRPRVSGGLPGIFTYFDWTRWEFGR